MMSFVSFSILLPTCSNTNPNGSLVFDKDWSNPCGYNTLYYN